MSFEPILQAAMRRSGGEAALAARLPQPKTPEELAAIDDARYLSLMSLRVFRAGLRHGLVDAKWPGFEDAFHGFEPRRVRAMSDEALEALMSDRRLIRHWGKLKSVRENAAALISVSDECDGFGRWLAGWPPRDIVGLWHEIGRRFAQMGGNSGPSFLRMAGKDTFLLTDSVVGALNHWGGFDGVPKGKRDRALVQERFNLWAAETGRPLCQLSMILALSVD